MGKEGIGRRICKSKLAIPAEAILNAQRAANMFRGYEEESRFLAQASDILQDRKYAKQAVVECLNTYKYSKARIILAETFSLENHKRGDHTYYWPLFINTIFPYYILLDTIVVFVIEAAAKSEIAQAVDSKKDVGPLLMIHNERVGNVRLTSVLPMVSPVLSRGKIHVSTLNWKAARRLGMCAPHTSAKARLSLTRLRHIDVSFCQRRPWPRKTPRGVLLVAD